MNFDELSGGERIFLQTVALCWHGLTKPQLLDIARELELRAPSGRAYTMASFNEVRDSLVKRGYLAYDHVLNGGGFQISGTRSREELTRLAIAEGIFERLASMINSLFDTREVSSFFNSADAQRTVRNYRLALYAGSADDVARLEKRFELTELPDWFEIVRLTTYSLPFQAEALRQLPNEKIIPMLTGIYRLCLNYDDSTTEFWRFVDENNFQNDIELNDLRTTEMLFRGEISQIKERMRSPQTAAEMLDVAVVAMLEGDFAQAVKLFMAGHTEWLRTVKKRKGFLNDWRMIVYALALYRTDQREFLTFANDFVKFFERQHGHDPVPRMIGILESYFSETKRRQNDWTMVPVGTIGDRLMATILAAIVPDAPLLPELDSFEVLSASHGFAWPLAEIANLRKLRDLPKLSTTPAESPVQFKILGGNIARPEAWERKLNVLLAAAEEVAPVEPPKKKATENETRVAWLLDPDSFGIQPVEQKLRRAVWSDGRNIALKRFAEDKVPHLTEADQTVIRAALQQSRNYYGLEHSLDWEKAILALVGNPHVFLADDTEVNVHLILTEPSLVISEQEDGIEVRFDSEIYGEGVTVNRESTTIFHVIKVEPKHARIAEALRHERLLVPKEGRQKLIAATQRLASAMNVRSDLAEDLELLPAVEADSRVRVLITPVGEWFRIAFFSKPFGSVPPFFKPGEGALNVTAEVDGVRTRTQRDPDEERDRARKLIAECASLEDAQTSEWEWELGGIEPLLATLADLEAPRGAGEIVIEWTRGNALKFRGRADYKNLQLSVRKPVKLHGKGWFDFSGFVKIDEKLVIPLRELAARMTPDGRGYVELDDGQFVALSERLAKRLAEINTTLDSKNRIHVLQSGLLDDLSEQVESFESDISWREHIKRVRAAAEFLPQIPPTFDAELRPYQIDGFNWLSRLAHLGFGACLADDMGLGKTLQALAVFVERAPLGPQLVVAPVSVCRNWLSEARRFAPTLNFHLFGDGDRTAQIETLGPFDVVVVSYSLLQANEKLFTSRKFTSIVLDEAQAIKNRQTQRSKAVMALDGDFKILTTGTPIENNLGELWNLFNFINPGLLGTYDYFYDRFALPIERHKSETARRTLHKLITPFILRRRKNQVLDDLPAKTEIVLTVELPPAERAQYEALRRESLARIESGIDRDQRFQILAELTRLRLACCHPRLVGGSASAETGGKLEVFGATLDELIAGKHRALVFSQFVKHLDLVREYLDKRGIVYQYLDGSTPSAKRQEAVDRFQRGIGDLFLISLRAGGMGLNLTSADYVIHLDPWWNPAVEDQASDRAHRIGQTRPVTVYRIVAADTVEEKIIKLHESKRDLADSLLDETDTTGTLSTEDLIALMKN